MSKKKKIKNKKIKTEVIPDEFESNESDQIDEFFSLKAVKTKDVLSLIEKFFPFSTKVDYYYKEIFITNDLNGVNSTNLTVVRILENKIEISYNDKRYFHFEKGIIKKALKYLNKSLKENSKETFSYVKNNVYSNYKLDREDKLKLIN